MQNCPPVMGKAPRVDSMKAQVGHRLASSEPKIAPSWPQESPSWCQIGHSRAQLGAKPFYEEFLKVGFENLDFYHAKWPACDAKAPRVESMEAQGCYKLASSEPKMVQVGPKLASREP